MAGLKERETPMTGQIVRFLHLFYDTDVVKSNILWCAWHARSTCMRCARYITRLFGECHVYCFVNENVSPARIVLRDVINSVAFL
jgi:hypothetical protein